MVPLAPPRHIPTITEIIHANQMWHVISSDSAIHHNQKVERTPPCLNRGWCTKGLQPRAGWTQTEPRLSSQLPTDGPWGQQVLAQVCVCVYVPATYPGRNSGFLTAALAVVAIWGVSPKMEALCFSITLSHSLKKKKISLPRSRPPTQRKREHPGALRLWARKGPRCH